jgi:hypothetical protein
MVVGQRTLVVEAMLADLDAAAGATYWDCLGIAGQFAGGRQGARVADAGAIAG